MFGFLSVLLCLSVPLHLTVIQVKYLFLVTIFYATRTGAFMGEVTSATVRVPEDPLSFLEGFVEEDFVVQKTVVKRSVGDASVDPRVPQYMLDLYDRLANRKTQVKFDIVRSIPCEGISDIEELSSSRSKKNDASNSYELVFNVSHFPHSEYVLLAQLRIQVVMPLEIKRFDTKRLDIFTLHENPPVLLSSRDLSPNTESLYTVDITKIFLKVLYSYEKQLVFGLSIPKGFKDFLMLDPLSTEGPQLLVMSKTKAQQGIYEGQFFTRRRRSLNMHNTELRSGNISKSVNVEKSIDLRNSSKALSEETEQSSYIVEDRGRNRKGKLRRKKNRCFRKSLTVNFTALNYNWIIAPEIYNAFQCSGRCSIPLSTPPTRYAIIKTQMHSLHPEQVSRPCCVPTEMDSIGLLYMDTTESFITYDKSYKDMIVQKCDCI